MLLQAAYAVVTETPVGTQVVVEAPAATPWWPFLVSTLVGSAIGAGAALIAGRYDRAAARGLRAEERREAREAERQALQREAARDLIDKLTDLAHVHTLATSSPDGKEVERFTAGVFSVYGCVALLEDRELVAQVIDVLMAMSMQQRRLLIAQLPEDEDDPSELGADWSERLKSMAPETRSRIDSLSDEDLSDEVKAIHVDALFRLGKIAQT